MTDDRGPTLDEIHITLDNHEDDLVYESDGTVTLAELGIRHRCPAGTHCADVADWRMESIAARGDG